MLHRFLTLALLMGALCLLPAGSKLAFATGEEPPEPTQCEVRQCLFFTEVPPVLQVSKCLPTNEPFTRLISVTANTRTRVSISHTDFIRQERDCDGHLLKTFDVIPSLKKVQFLEVVHCPDGGAPLEARQLTEGSVQTWCVNPHRGGYAIQLSLIPSRFDLCDDAGCYKAEAIVEVCLLPFQEVCPIIDP